MRGFGDASHDLDRDAGPCAPREQRGAELERRPRHERMERDAVELDLDRADLVQHEQRGLGRRRRWHGDERQRFGEAGCIALEPRALLGRQLGDDRDVAAAHRAAKEVGEAALALPRLAEPAEQVQIFDPQDAPAGARVVEQREAALFPFAEPRHAGDHALAAEPEHVVAAIQVAMQRIAVFDESFGDPLADQRGLAAAGQADDRRRARPRAAEQVREPLAIRRARHAERDAAGRNALGLVDRDRLQHSLRAARARALIALLRRQLVEQRLRLGRKRDGDQPIAAIGAQRLVELVVVVVIAVRRVGFEPVPDHRLRERGDVLARLGHEPPVAARRVIAEQALVLWIDPARLDDQWNRHARAGRRLDTDAHELGAERQLEQLLLRRLRARECVA